MKRFVSLVCLTLLMGCQPDVADIQLQIDKIKATTNVSIEPYPEFKRMPVFEYQAQNQRSPFQRLSAGISEAPVTTQKNCLQPDFKRKKQPLERYGIDALEVKGSFTSKGNKWALIQSSDGGLYKVKQGDYLGLFFGQVTSINNNTVVLTEMLPDGTGCWQKKQAKLTRASKAGEQNNV